MYVISLTEPPTGLSLPALKSTSLMRCICCPAVRLTLLKTLEEPPDNVKFIFATTEIRKVPVTILSRCQRFDLRRVPVDVMSDHLTAISEQEGHHSVS